MDSHGHLITDSDSGRAEYATKQRGNDTKRDDNGHGIYKQSVGVVSVLWQWRLEFVAFLCSCGLLAAISGILATNDGKMLQSWSSKSGISLNALIAVLSAVLRAFVLAVLEEVISQYKWIWQTQSRPVAHLNSIDEASRGLWGSIMLPVRLRAWFSYVYVGCVLMVLSLAIGPLTQQAVATKNCVQSIAGAPAMVPYTYEGVPTFRVAAGQYRLEPGFLSAIVSASVNAGASNTSVSLVKGCSSGNCTFPTGAGGASISTFGVCSKCMDTTHYIQKNDTNGTITMGIPRVVQLKPGYGHDAFQAWSASNLEWAKSDFTDDIQAAFPASIKNFTFLGMTTDGCTYKDPSSPVESCKPAQGIDFISEIYQGGSKQQFNLYSSTCTLYWCMRHHKVSVDLNSLEETLVAESPAFYTSPSRSPAMDLSRNVTTWKPTCDVDGVTLDLTRARTVSYNNDSIQAQLAGPGSEIKDIPRSADCTTWVPQMGTIATAAALSLINGTCIYPNTAEVSSLQTRVEHVNCEPWNLSGLMNGGLASVSSTADAVAAIANAITNHMREMAVQKNFNMTGQAYIADERGGYVHGEVRQTTVCTVFLWKWLLGPALILLVTAWFFIQTIIRSVVERNREPLWKGSLLPALYLNPGSQMHTSGHDLKDLQRRAEGDVVRLSKTGEGTWELLKKTDEGVGIGRSRDDQVALVDMGKDHRG